MNASTSIPTPSAAGNALLDFSDLPLFDQITPAQVQPAVAQLLADCQSGLDRAVQPDFPADWQQLALALDVPAEWLGRAWGAVGHLKSVHETPELRDAYNAMLPVVTEFFTRLGADERLYAKYKAIDAASLNAEQQQALKNTLRGFVLGGAELVGADKEIGRAHV